MSEGTFTLTFGGTPVRRNLLDRLLRRPQVFIPNTTEPIAFGASAADVQKELRKTFGDGIVVRKSGDAYVVSSGEK